ncbi:MAG: hypothetical protein V4733_03775 [Verrucomicrobiota bacterium]
MAAAIKGKQIVWGVPAGGITLAHAATTSGIVESIDIESGGETAEINDEDGDVVTRVDHGTENKVTINVIAIVSTALPEKGDELTGLPAIDGIALNTGRVFVDTSKVTYTGKDAKKISITAVHYPTMPADL